MATAVSYEAPGAGGCRRMRAASQRSGSDRQPCPSGQMGRLLNADACTQQAQRSPSKRAGTMRSVKSFVQAATYAAAETAAGSWIANQHTGPPHARIVPEREVAAFPAAAKF